MFLVLPISTTILKNIEFSIPHFGTLAKISWVLNFAFGLGAPSI
jgi:hypothetical protein